MHGRRRRLPSCRRRCLASTSSPAYHESLDRLQSSSWPCLTHTLAVFVLPTTGSPALTLKTNLPPSSLPYARPRAARRSRARRRFVPLYCPKCAPSPPIDVHPSPFLLFCSSLRCCQVVDVRCTRKSQWLTEARRSRGMQGRPARGLGALAALGAAPVSGALHLSRLAIAPWLPSSLCSLPRRCKSPHARLGPPADAGQSPACNSPALSLAPCPHQPSGPGSQPVSQLQLRSRRSDPRAAAAVSRLPPAACHPPCDGGPGAVLRAEPGAGGHQPGQPAAGGRQHDGHASAAAVAAGARTCGRAGRPDGGGWGVQCLCLPGLVVQRMAATCLPRCSLRDG